MSRVLASSGFEVDAVSTTSSVVRQLDTPERGFSYWGTRRWTCA